MALKPSVVISYACSVLALLSTSNGYNVKVTPSESVLLIDFKSSVAVSQNFSIYAGYNFVASIEANNELSFTPTQHVTKSFTSFLPPTT
ncbi:unnamed protein product [Clavelina lepadiformis]|uniref:Uncharacterized protein n=1 Tax=Clavelina lepadiformis TaxID=159417 RepID=A0ABP0H098_CLALP